VFDNGTFSETDESGNTEYLAEGDKAVRSLYQVCRYFAGSSQR